MFEKLVFLLIEWVAERNIEGIYLGHGDCEFRRCYVFPSGRRLYVDEDFS